MLSLARLGRGREDYHLRAVGVDASEYYSERGEVAGRWLGGGARDLGLRGRVQDRALLAVLAGYAPGARRQEDGSWLGVRLVARVRSGRRTPGFDACFEAPKSVSLLWAFGDRLWVGGRRLDRVVEQAHDQAVSEAMAYLERAAARGRRGTNGLHQVGSSGFVAAVFRQRTSRANDPHLHSHVLVANLCRGEDGRWGALDARLLYAHAKAAGHLYQAHLRYRLSVELRVKWTGVVHGIADVMGVPETMIERFSKRSREIRGRVAEVTERINRERARLGLEPITAVSAEALDLAARQTRAAKLQHLATSELRAGWRKEAEAAGLDPDRLARALCRVRGAPPLRPDPGLHRRVTARLTEHASTFGERDVVQALAADARPGLPASEVLARAAALFASRDVIPVVGALRDQDVIRRADGRLAPVPTGERRWSTPEMLALEAQLVETALWRRRERVALVPEEALAALRAGWEGERRLGPDQVELVRRLARSGAGVECVEAGPGTGKTTALGLYVAACRRAGIPVVGCAPSARARDELRRGAGIERCHTLDRLLLELARKPLEPGAVVILNEASMAGSRKLARLLEQAAATRARVVLVGDTKQLSSVDAGGGFRGLVARLGAQQLLTNRRQAQPWEREALGQLRQGRVAEALAADARHGCLHLGERESLIEAMVEAWWWARSRGEAVMQACRWRDVRELNRRARERLVQAGLVEPEGLEVRGLTVGVGDQVLVLRNAPRLGVINGTLGTVVAIDQERGEICLRTIEPEPRLVRLPSGFWNARGRRRLSLAYCRTVHQAPGATYRGVSLTLAGDEALPLEALHVALSRGTEENHPYYPGEPPPDEGHHHPEVMEPTIEGLVAAAGRSRAQVMALDLVQGLESGTAASGRRARTEPRTGATGAGRAAMAERVGRDRGAEDAVAAWRRSRRAWARWRSGPNGPAALMRRTIADPASAHRTPRGRPPPAG